MMTALAILCALAIVLMFPYARAEKPAARRPPVPWIPRQNRAARRAGKTPRGAR
jgi:hypothetical protein